jgi:hypothetical protein
MRFRLHGIGVVRNPRTLLVHVVIGMVATVAVAWACALWSPVRRTVDPFPNPMSIRNTVDPDGKIGLYYQETGVGWGFMYQRGERSLRDPSDVFWNGPYGGEQYRIAGWPVAALRSRVRVLDSQAAGRFGEGEVDPRPKRQRLRWELPWSEIIHRGIATKDLPDFIHPASNRRLPLVPLAWGFAVDTTIYALIATIFVFAFKSASAHWRRMPRGFPVSTNDQTGSSNVAYQDDTAIK